MNEHSEGPAIPKQIDETETCIVQKQEDSISSPAVFFVEEKVRSCEEIETEVLNDLASTNTSNFPAHRLVKAKITTSNR